MTKLALNDGAASIAGGLDGLQADLRLHFARMFPGVSPETPLRFRPLSVASSHPLVVAETAGGARRRLLLKGRRKHTKIFQSLETERDVLMTVGPKLHALSPSTRCPMAVAYYAEPEVLVMEYVDAPRLDELQFGLRGGDRRQLPRWLELCAQWLVRFHSLTETPDEGNPFEWLRTQLGRSPRPALFSETWRPDGYEELMARIGTLARQHADVRVRRCLIHDEFAPYHVLVGESCIYVIDLASARSGYPFEDLAYFCASLEALLPWRRAVGGLRMSIAEQRRLFLKAYFDARPELREIGDVLTRLALLESMVAFLGHSRSKDGWKTRVYSAIARPWVDHRFRVICDRELAALRELTP